MTAPLCLDDLDDDALDRLPFGVVVLSPNGIVERINRVEIERANIQRWRAVGRDYFRELAPALAAPVEALRPGESAHLFHTFRGFHRADDAVVDVSRCPEGRVTLCIRRTVSAPARAM